MTTRVETPLEAAEYGNYEKGVPQCVGDKNTVRGWHLNVFCRPPSPQDPEDAIGGQEPRVFDFLVFSPERQHARGTFIRANDRDWILRLSKQASTLRGLPEKCENRLRDLADEFDIVLTGLGK